MARVLPATLTASVPKWASASGPLGVYCCRRTGTSDTCSVQTPGEGWGGGSREERSGCRGGHIGTSFPQTLKTPFECIWSIPARCEEGATDVDGVDQSLEYERADTELRRVLSKLEVDARSLAQDLHPLAGSGSSHGELRHWFQLRHRDAQRDHRLRRNDIGKGVATVDEGCGGQVSQSDQDIRTVVLCLTGLEIDLRNLGAGGGHRCKTGQGMSKHFFGHNH